jgi:chemotaxis protein MotB
MAHRRSTTGAEGEKRDWPPDWMTTYSDMATLMMTFFIILSTMLALNIDITWIAGQDMITLADRRVEEAIDVDLTEEEQDLLERIRQLKEHQMRELARIDEMRQMAKEIQQYIIDANLSRFVRVDISKWKLKIIPLAPFLFRPASADLRQEGKEFLALLAGFFLQSPDAEVRIGGHTDSIPINTPRYPSNWELSCARATAVMRYLIDEEGVDPAILSAIGHGPHQPVAANDTSEGRAMNRRVEIEIIQRPGDSPGPPAKPAGSDSGIPESLPERD